MEQTIMDIVGEISGCSKERLHSGSLIIDLGINSLTIIQIMVRIEEELGIEISDEDLDLSKIIKLEDLFVLAKSLRLL
ncbi:acyl carrier protein [Paenibacillus mesotrionivorans]|uniref:Acyl carrier protein n=1 Tax=Paenibacillus mesotrionivorans TaxID=3160968 RepID=A0ACC7NXF5_9BACL